MTCPTGLLVDVESNNDQNEDCIKVCYVLLYTICGHGSQLALFQNWSILFTIVLKKWR